MDGDELIASGDMEAENQGVALGTPASDEDGRRARSRNARRIRSRWLVHLGLLVAAAAALGTLQLLHIRNAIHAGVGLAFAGLVVIHLAQRRHRIAGMLARFRGLSRHVVRELRLLASDAILAFITASVVVSGLLDWNHGSPLLLPLLPRPFGRWHLLSSVALIVYLIIHVSRRWRRLRRSTIR